MALIEGWFLFSQTYRIYGIIGIFLINALSMLIIWVIQSLIYQLKTKDYSSVLSPNIYTFLPCIVIFAIFCGLVIKLPPKIDSPNSRFIYKYREEITGENPFSVNFLWKNIEVKNGNIKASLSKNVVEDSPDFEEVIFTLNKSGVISNKSSNQYDRLFSCFQVFENRTLAHRRSIDEAIKLDSYSDSPPANLSYYVSSKKQNYNLISNTITIYEKISDAKITMPGTEAFEIPADIYGRSYYKFNCTSGVLVYFELYIYIRTKTIGVYKIKRSLELEN